MIESTEIFEFRTSWNNELFFKNRLLRTTSKRLVQKSINITRGRLFRHLKIVENDLVKQLEQAEKDYRILAEFSDSDSFSKNLQKRLENLQNEVKCHDQRVKSLLEQEKQFWKELTQIISRKTDHNTNEAPSEKIDQPRKTTTQRATKNNRTFVTYSDKNDENRAPNESKSLTNESQSPTKLPKIRKRK